jgi:hypothetical protein
MIGCESILEYSMPSSLARFALLMWLRNPGPLGLVKGRTALPLGISSKSRWPSHESGVKPGSLSPDTPIQAISLRFF